MRATQPKLAPMGRQKRPFPQAQPPNPVNAALLATVPEGSPLKLVGQWGDEHTVLVRGEVEGLALHWQVRKDMYPTVALSSPCCDAPLWDLSSGLLFGSVNWACYECPTAVESFPDALPTGWGINTNPNYDYTYDWKDRLAIIDRWTSRALYETDRVNPLVATLAEPDIIAVNSWFMDRYRHGVVDSLLEDLNSL